MDVEGGGGPSGPPEWVAPGTVPLPVETQVVSRGPSRRRLALVVGAVVVVAGAVTGILLASGDDEVDPEAALAAAQELAEESESYRFEQLAETSVSMGDPEGSGTDTTTRTLLTGTVAAPDRWHIVEDLGDMGFGGELGLPSEAATIRVGDDLYSSGFTMPGSASPPWVALPVPDELPTAADLAEAWDFTDLGFDEGFLDPYLDEMRLGLAIQAYLSDETGDPTAVTRVVTQLSEPVLEEERADGGLVLRARLAPVPALASLDEIPPVDAVVHLDADRRPVTVRFTAEAGSASADVQVTFSDWGSSLEVDAPPEADVDRTPWVSEEDLATLDPALLLAPTAVPAPFELVSATVYDDSVFFGELPGVDAGDAGPCPSLTLSYASEDSAVPDLDDFDDLDEIDYLDLTVRDPSCGPDVVFGDLELADELGGLPAEGYDGYWTVQVGEVHVELSTTLDDGAAGALVASLRPTTADALVAAIPEWVADAGFGGAWFAGSPFGFGAGFGFGSFFPG